MLTVLAMIGAVLSLLTSITVAIIAPATGPDSPVIAWLDLLLDLVVPVLVLLGLAKLLPRRPAANGTPLQSPSVPDAVSTETAPAALPNPQAEPVWQPDAASGVAWHTAGDAALGAPASGWGTPGEASGWHAIAEDEDPQRGDRSGQES
jgi:hypothetical protein